MSTIYSKCPSIYFWKCEYLQMEPDMIGKDVQIKSALLFCKPFHTIIMMKAMKMLGRLVGKAKRVLC